MGKSITNKIYETYLTRLFSYISSKIGYPKLSIKCLFRTEIMKNIMV